MIFDQGEELKEMVISSIVHLYVSISDLLAMNLQSVITYR